MCEKKKFCEMKIEKNPFEIFSKNSSTENKVT